MNKDDEYRTQADECQRMARKAASPLDKAAWLRMAEDWLRLSHQPDRSLSDKFDAAQAKQGTHQARSDAAH